jgi:hypothetical protein
MGTKDTSCKDKLDTELRIKDYLQSLKCWGHDGIMAASTSGRDINFQHRHMRVGRLVKREIRASVKIQLGIEVRMAGYGRTIPSLREPIPT